MGLDTVELLLFAEKEFDIEITDDEAGNIFTVGEFSNLCFQKLQLKPSNPLNEEQVFIKLTQILRQHFVGKNFDIQRNQRIVKDLGLD